MHGQTKDASDVALAQVGRYDDAAFPERFNTRRAPFAPSLAP